MSWEDEHGFQPGAKRLSNGQKARQNKSIICPQCSFDTGKHEDKKAGFSDWLRKINVGAYDLDFITNACVIEHTSGNLRSGVFPVKYLEAIDDLRNRSGNYDQVILATQNLKKKFAIIILFDYQAGLACSKVLWHIDPALPVGSWHGPTDLEALGKWLTQQCT